MEVSDQLHNLDTLPQKMIPQDSLDRGMGGSQSQSGCGGKEKNINVPAKNQTQLVHPIT
jgi:hypothetical protein